MGTFTELANELRIELNDYFVTAKNNITPNLSIVVLTRNNGKKIIDCLSAILMQTYKNFELIILDNNSSDVTEDVIHILTCDSRIQVLNCKKQGLKFNIKEAIKHISTNRVLVIKPNQILGQEDIEILIQNNKIKEFPHINYYSKLDLMLIKMKRFFKEYKEAFHDEN